MIQPLKPQHFQETFRSILMEVAEVDVQKLHPKATLKDELGLDSLDMVELVMIFEKEFMISLPDHQWMRAKTVADIEGLIRDLLMIQVERKMPKPEAESTAA
ncbi:MAG: acyl carrier protein [Bacteroidota bacterium]